MQHLREAIEADGDIEKACLHMKYLGELNKFQICEPS